MEQIKVADNAAIYQAVSDYYEGWYTPNVKQMEQCLHANLAKRAIKLDDTGNEYLRHLTKDMMVEGTREGGGSKAPSEKKNWTITILDSYEEIATVKVASGEYMEYIHLARQGGQWLIVNVIYTGNREEQ
jgi:putative lumazine-binding protein